MKAIKMTKEEADIMKKLSETRRSLEHSMGNIQRQWDRLWGLLYKKYNLDKKKYYTANWKTGKIKEAF